MKRLLTLLTGLGLGAVLVLGNGMKAQAQAQSQSTTQADQKLIERGRYLAVAADCAACHGDKSAGGLALATPMGPVYASNITPDPTDGIGNWTEQEFGNALRRGRSPDKGWLYPAMPYTAYTGLNDDDVSALYAYFHGAVAPSSSKVPETRLPFPFMRPMMIGWNLLNLDAGHASGAVPVDGPMLQRGQYLIETLGHCSACHTPRNTLMGEIGSEHLAGALVGTWEAPNITPSINGIGSWSDADLKKFLQTGNANNQVASGDMGLAVEHSFSHMSNSDLDSMVAYLRHIPAVDGAPTRAPVGQARALDIAELEAVPDAGTEQSDYTAVKQGSILYQAACASCHGARGEGTPDGLHPSLVRNGTVRMLNPDNLVQVIAHGIDVNTPSGHALMPGFSDQMTSAQIASLASYVRRDLGNLPSPTVTEQQVEKTLANKGTAPWLIVHAALLAVVGIIVVLLLCVLIASLFVRRHRSRGMQRR
jgi:mono/diheme cytochrome c family protein